MEVAPGQVFWAYHDKRRPVLVVSRAQLNRGHDVVVVPLTTARLEERRVLPNCVLLTPERHGVPKRCVAQADRISVISMSDLVHEDGVITELDGEAMRELIRAIGFVIEAECEPS